MSCNPAYGLETRLLAVELFERGRGWRSLARTFGVPNGAVRQRLGTCRVVGIGALRDMGTKKTIRETVAEIFSRAPANERRAKGDTAHEIWPTSCHGEASLHQTARKGQGSM